MSLLPSFAPWALGHLPRQSARTVGRVVGHQPNTRRRSTEDETTDVNRSFTRRIAGGGGLEPPLPDPKSGVLPLNYPPSPVKCRPTEQHLPDETSLTHPPTCHEASPERWLLWPRGAFPSSGQIGLHPHPLIFVSPWGPSSRSAASACARRSTRRCSSAPVGSVARSSE